MAMSSLFGTSLNVIFFPLVFVLIAFYFKLRYSKWKRIGVDSSLSMCDGIKHQIQLLFGTKPLNELQQGVYYKFPNARFVGSLNVTDPVLMIRDAELVEKIFIKDFTSFMSRNSEDPNASVFSKHLLNYDNEKWHNLRLKLSPAFSSGKLKGMHSQLVDCSEALIEFLRKYENSPFEAREVSARFTTDVIASCAFGLNADSINDPDSKFREIGRTMFKPSKVRRAFLFIRKFSWFWRKLGLRGMPKEHQDFFINTVNNTLEYRKNNNYVRQDFLHLMNELKVKDEEILKNGKSAKPPLIFDHTVLMSNAFVFFVAGFETTASTISYTLYELSLHEDIQEKLFREVEATLKKHGGELSYDAVHDMHYLEQVISETLRCHPPAVEITRKSSQKYQIPDSDVVLPIGSLVTIPVYSIHHDPRYYENPEKFDPDRFSPENKDLIGKGTYLPFGDGPRICIGARFAKLEMKVVLAQIIKNYKIMKCSKTMDPIKYDSSGFLLIPEGGIWISIQSRKQ